MTPATLDNILTRLRVLEGECGLVPGPGNPLGSGIGSHLAPLRADIDDLRKCVEHDHALLIDQNSVYALECAPERTTIRQWIATQMLHLAGWIEGN